MLSFKCFMTLHNLFHVMKIIYYSRNAKVIAIIYETKNTAWSRAHYSNRINHWCLFTANDHQISRKEEKHEGQNGRHNGSISRK